MLPVSGSNCETPRLLLIKTSILGAHPEATIAVAKKRQNPIATKRRRPARIIAVARKTTGLRVEMVESFAVCAIGAGVLDINAALDETGTLSGAALSPLMALGTAPDGSAVVLVESTEDLWADPQWAGDALWSDSYLWSNGEVVPDDYVWTEGYLWSNGDPLFDGVDSVRILNDD